MKKVCLVLTGLFLMMVLLQASMSFSQDLVRFDENKKIAYISESAWDMLPVHGEQSKEYLLKEMKLPPGWKVRGMYTNKLLAEITWTGKIIIKEY